MLDVDNWNSKFKGRPQALYATVIHDNFHIKVSDQTSRFSRAQSVKITVHLATRGLILHIRITVWFSWANKLEYFQISLLLATSKAESLSNIKNSALCSATGVRSVITFKSQSAFSSVAEKTAACFTLALTPSHWSSVPACHLKGGCQFLEGRILSIH